MVDALYEYKSLFGKH